MSARILLFCIFAAIIGHTLSQCIRNGPVSYNTRFGITNSRIGQGAFGTTCNSVIPAASPLWPPSAASGNWAETFPGLSPLDFSIVSANNGGSFNVQSSSSIAPNSISVKSENAIEGALSLNGMLPFLSTVALDGTLPSFGAGSTAYRCGEGVAILSENIGISDILEEASDNIGAINIQSNGLTNLGKDIGQCRSNNI